MESHCRILEQDGLCAEERNDFGSVAYQVETMEVQEEKARDKVDCSSQDSR